MSDGPSSLKCEAVGTLVAPHSLFSNPTTAESLRPKLRSSILFVVIVFSLVGSFAWRNLSKWPAIISYPDDESYESVPLATMIHLRQGVPIYAPGAIGHFDGATYGPFYYLLGARLVNPAKPSYVPLRLLSTFAILGCAAGCGLLAFWLTQNRLAACLGSFVLVSYGAVTGHGLAALSDSVALLLAFSGFLVAYRFRNSRAILLAVPIMVLSFYYKPQYIASSLAVQLFLLLEKRYRVAFEFAGLLGVCSIGLFALFQWVVFSGQAFWRHFVLYQSSSLAPQLLGRTLFVCSLLLLLPIIFAVEYIRTYPNKLIGCYLFFAILLGVFTLCKGAGGTHYLFESVLILCTLVPALLAKLHAPGAYPLHLVLVLGIMLVAGQLFEPSAPQPSDIERYDAVESYLLRNFSHRAPALCPNPGELLHAGLEAPFSGLYELAAFSRTGRVSDGDLVAEIQGHRFAAIIFPFDVSQEHDPYWLKFYATPAVLRAIASDYQLDTSLDMPVPLRQRSRDRSYVYVPRPVATEPANSGEGR